MKVLFSCRDTYYFDYPLIAEILTQEYGVEASALTYSTKTYNLLKRKYPGAFKEVYNLDDFFHGNNDFVEISAAEKIEYLSQLETKLQIPSLSSPLYVDRTLMRNGYEDILAIAYGMAKFTERIPVAEFDLIISEIGTFLEYLIRQISSVKGVLYISLSSSRFRGRIAFFEGDNGEALGLRKHYHFYKTSNLSEEEEKLFQDFYDDFLRGGKKPEYFEKFGFFKRVQNIVHAYRERAAFQNKSRYILESIDTSSIKHLVKLRFMRVCVRSLLKARGFFHPLSTSKFIYFPLHLQPELSTLLYAPYYVDQIATIENIAKSIPVDCVLAVKEHPSMFGLRDISFYKEIMKLPNVRLIDPLVDSYHIIREAEGVIVLTSTVGLESIMLQKPVIILGNVFYEIYDLACKVDNIKELPQALKQYLREFRPDMTSLKKFVVAYLKSSYEGVLDDPIPKKGHLTKENLNKITFAITEILHDETR